MKPFFKNIIYTIIILSIYIITTTYFITINKFLYIPIIYILLTSIFIILFKTYIISFLGNLNYTSGNIEKAIKYYDLAIKKNTKIPTVYLNYAVYILNEGNVEKALNYLNKAKNINNNIIIDKNIKVTIACCYWAYNEIDKSIEILENLRYEYEYVNVNVLCTLGYMYFLKNMYDKALEITNLAFEEDNNCAAVLDSLGQIYFAKNDLKKAKKNFKKALNINKYLLESNYYLAIIYEKENNYDKAKHYFLESEKCKVTIFSYIKEEQIKEKIKKYK